VRSDAEIDEKNVDSRFQGLPVTRFAAQLIETATKKASKISNPMKALADA
jgi:hypothetical protein